MTDTYSQFATEVKACTACKLCETRLNVVVDRGNPNADLAIIGEAPDAYEDKIGECSVGAEGKFINDTVARAGLDDFVIFNILKCRPPGNLFPGHPDSTAPLRSVLKCLPHFDRQFDLIKPKVVLLAGLKAVEWTIYRDRRPVPAFDDLVHKWFRSEDYKDVDFLTVYSPNHILRTRSVDLAKHEDMVAQTDKILRWAKELLGGVTPRAAVEHLKRSGRREPPVQGRLF